MAVCLMVAAPAIAHPQLLRAVPSPWVDGLLHPRGPGVHGGCEGENPPHPRGTRGAEELKPAVPQPAQPQDEVGSTPIPLCMVTKGFPWPESEGTTRFLQMGRPRVGLQEEAGSLGPWAGAV